MPSTEVLIAFTAAAIILNISPGPSSLYVVSRAIAQGAKGGIVAAMGLAVGSVVHVVATVVGISAVFSHSPTLYTAVKLAGAAYLIYLGISYWKSKPLAGRKNVTQARKKPLFTIFRESIIVEVTNPKTALFFIALLPQFVVPESGPISQQLLIFGLIVTISALPCDVIVAISFSKASQWLIKNKRAQQIQEQLSGSILLAMGTFIVADEVVDFDR